MHAHPFDETMGGQSFKELTVMLKFWSNSLPVLKQTDKNRKTTYPFFQNPNKRDITIFTILMATNHLLQRKGGEDVLLYDDFSMDDGIEQCFSSADDAVVIDDPMAMTAVRR
jgi:hypothetical protein